MAGNVLVARTVLGRPIYTVGSNERAAYLAVVNTVRVKTAAYVSNGIVVGFAGVLLVSRLGAGIPNAGLQLSWT